MEICKICNREFKSMRSLSHHVRSHGIDMQKYYEDYLGVVLCEFCKKPLTYRQIQQGYTRCSHACSASITKNRAGTTTSDDSRKRMSESHIGNKQSEETKRKISNMMKTVMIGNDHGKGNRGKKRSEEIKRKQSQKVKRYLTDVDYHMKHLITPSSQQYRIDALSYYGVRCECCGSTYNFFHVHHLDGDRSNNDITNLCVLCRDCHNGVAHTSKGWYADYELTPGFHRMILIKRLINILLKVYTNNL